MAETWIESLREVDEVFSIRTAELTPLIGLAGLICELENDSAELSYWIGRAYWGYGYASEAVKSIVAFGFEQMGLHRIFATCLARNAASARILEVNGFTREGLLRQHVKHWHNFENLLYFGILKEEYFRKS